MSNISNGSIVQYIYNGDVAFSTKEYELLRKESKALLITPLKGRAFLWIIKENSL